MLYGDIYNIRLVLNCNSTRSTRPRIPLLYSRLLW